MLQPKKSPSLRLGVHHIGRGFRTRDYLARNIERNWADLVNGARIAATQFARCLDRSILVGAIEDIEAKQLFLGLGERTVDDDAVPRTTQGACAAGRAEAR